MVVSTWEENKHNTLFNDFIVSGISHEADFMNILIKIFGIVLC